MSQKDDDEKKERSWKHVAATNRFFCDSCGETIARDDVELGYTSRCSACENVFSGGSSEIFNTDQGSQFTSLAFTDVLTDAGIHISMDGKGRWMDNVFIERLWRSLKYEQVYLAEYATASDARAGIGWWIDFYNERRPHSSLVDRTPNEAYTLGATPGPGRYPAPSQPEAA